MIATAAVHTAGVNWESVAAIVSAVCAVFAIMASLIARYLGNKITGAIDSFRIQIFEPLDKRVFALELLARLYHPNPPEVLKAMKDVQDGTP
jgi:hypothetical protein